MRKGHLSFHRYEAPSLGGFVIFAALGLGGLFSVSWHRAHCALCINLSLSRSGRVRSWQALV